MTSPVPAGFAEAGPARVSGAATSAKHSAATPPLPQRRVDGVDKLVLLGTRSAEGASWAWPGCSRGGRAGTGGGGSQPMAGTPGTVAPGYRDPRCGKESGEP